MSNGSRRARPWVLLLLAALSLIGATEYRLAHHPLSRDAGRRLLYVPNGRFLQVAALGHRTFLADLMYLWSIQYYGSYKGEQRFEYLEQVFGNVIARLDPQYVDPYLIGALILVTEKRDVEAGLRLLDQGIAANPDAWILPYEAGFWAYDTAGDYQRAARYFEAALRIPGAPPSVRRLRAAMYEKKGDKATSLALWREILEEAQEPMVQAIAANHVHDLAIEVDLERLRAALAAYQERFGRLPPRLESLVRSGILDAVPRDPDGEAYGYDPASGQVSPASPFRLRRR